MDRSRLTLFVRFVSRFAALHPLQEVDQLPKLRNASSELGLPDPAGLRRHGESGELSARPEERFLVPYRHNFLLGPYRLRARTKFSEAVEPPRTARKSFHSAWGCARFLHRRLRSLWKFAAGCSPRFSGYPFRSSAFLSSIPPDPGEISIDRRICGRCRLCRGPRTGSRRAP